MGAHLRGENNLCKRLLLCCELEGSKQPLCCSPTKTGAPASPSREGLSQTKTALQITMQRTTTRLGLPSSFTTNGKNRCTSWLDSLAVFYWHVAKSCDETLVFVEWAWWPRRGRVPRCWSPPWRGSDVVGRSSHVCAFLLWKDLFVKFKCYLVTSQTEISKSKSIIQ